MQQDFTTVITTEKSPMEVFNAINNVREWWKGAVEGPSAKPGDVFSYRYADVHYSQHKVEELIPGKRVVWLTTDSSLSFVNDKHEWTGTRIIFDIEEKNGRTELRFSHEGLVPQFECYDACSGAWSQIVSRSMSNFLSKGEGIDVFA